MRVGPKAHVTPAVPLHPHEIQKGPVQQGIAIPQIQTPGAETVRQHVAQEIAKNGDLGRIIDLNA